jgi:PPP family 3-phenylpropionic acid transporter
VLWFGPETFVWLLAFACFARFLAAIGLPRLRDAEQPRTRSEGTFLSRDVIAAFRPWVLLPVIAGAILFANHMVMNAFSSLVWKQQGLNESTIGFLIALGAAAEAATMFAWKRINFRFPARILILIAGAVSVLRWIGMTLSPPLWLIVLMQLGQAVTFTFSYLGCLYFIAKRTGEDISAEAQSLFGVMMQGFSIVIVASFGVAFGVIGVNAFWICVALSAVAMAMVQVSLKIRGPDPSD